MKLKHCISITNCYYGDDELDAYRKGNSYSYVYNDKYDIYIVFWGNRYGEYEDFPIEDFNKYFVDIEALVDERISNLFT